MSKRIIYLFFSLLFIILFAGCAPKCTDEEINSFYPILQSPVNGSEVDFDNPPTFDWTHNESCVPSNYSITFVKNGVEPVHFTVDGDTTHFNRDTPFHPGTYYDWYVKAFNHHSGDNSFYNHFGPPSASFSFTTDGMCSGSELVAPIPVNPPFGAWLGEAAGPGPAAVNIEWSYPGNCTPKGFHYVVAADPGFTNIVTSGITDREQYSAAIQVPRCTRIYWKVQARDGNISGEYSEPSRFTYASISSCFQNQQSIDASLIKGYVFEDYCGATVPYVPEGVGIAPPCVFGEPYGVHADGIRARVASENSMTGAIDPAEIGIPGVIVDLGAGPCPSTGLDQFTTVENGNYFFMVQSPGEYCVSIDKSKNPSLDHGIWTLPLTDQDVTEATITFNQGDNLLMQNFGWDKNDFLRIEFLVDQTSFCRLGDSKDHQAVAQVPAGMVIPIFARNEDATWFATIVDGKRCFISTVSGAPTEDPFELLIFPIQPEPIIPDLPPVPSSKSCSDYKTEDACMNNGCEWVFSTFGPGSCKAP